MVGEGVFLLSGTQTKHRKLGWLLAGALALTGLATALHAASPPTAEELLRSVQSGGDAPASPASPASPADRRQRARRIVQQLQQRLPAATRPGLKTGTAEELLREVQSTSAASSAPSTAPAARPRVTDDFDAPTPRTSAPRLLRPAAGRTPRRNTIIQLFVGAQKDAEYAGTERCLACHRGYGEEGRASLSALYAVSEAILVSQRRGCEGCHGPGSKHADGKIDAITNPRKLTKMGQADLCFSCHAVVLRAGDPVLHFPGHSANHVGCLNCHRVHSSAAEKFLKEEPNRLCMSCHRDVATEFLRRSRHPLGPEEPSPRSSQHGGKMRCIDCHLNWSRRRDPNGREPTVDTCQNCHAETRGPFLFSHDAGSAEMADGCQACHLPHGSPNRHLLRASGRSLCLSCHSDFATGHFPGPTCTTTACHQDIHGSNTNVFLVR